MQLEILQLLKCPDDQGDLLPAEKLDGAQLLCCVSCDKEYPVVNGIPRFVEFDDYNENFGFQWNKFRKTQLDSHAGIRLSRNRFYQQSGWNPDQLSNKKILDVGCGAGRFTEIALDAGAVVFAIDYSNAIEACQANHSHRDNLHLFQADIYRLPFLAGSFDYIFCFGVLQHTPNVEQAFQQIPPLLKPGGKVCVDVYLRKWNRYFHPKRVLRPFTTRMNRKVLFRLLQRLVPVLLGLNRLLRMIPVVGHWLTRIVPVADYSGLYGLKRIQIKEWALLDTFDWLAPTYDSPQTPDVLRRWMNRENLVNIEVEVSGFVVGRASKKFR